jgi:hypothetical protein
MKINSTLFWGLVFSLLCGCDRNIICTEAGVAHQDLGSGYHFINHECQWAIIYDTSCGDCTTIQEDVLELAYDSTFIVVSQRPYNDLSIVDFDKMTQSERHAALERSTFRQYWIINKRGPRYMIIDYNDSEKSHDANVYGPYQKDEFVLRRRQLGVPDSLTLRPAIPRDE